VRKRSAASIDFQDIVLPRLRIAAAILVRLLFMIFLLLQNRLNQLQPQRRW